MTPSQPTIPGSCALRLENLEQQTSLTKGELMESIATDICATFISIAKHSEAGTLQAMHTRPIDRVIMTIRDTDVRQRRSLEKQVRRLRKERNWTRKKYSKIARETDALACAYKLKVRRLSSSLLKAQEEAEQLRSELDVLRACMKKRGIDTEPVDEDVDGEFEVDT